jgi:hypothetical protein
MRSKVSRDAAEPAKGDTDLRVTAEANLVVERIGAR